MAKEEMTEKQQQLLAMIDTFCTQKLNEEYNLLCKKILQKLSNQNEIPFKRGKLEIWAAAVAYTIGSINFLFDKQTVPYLSTDEISEYFGTKNSTVSNKAREIKEMLNIGYFSSEFSTQKMAEINPLNYWVMVDGLIVDIAKLPEDLQQQVRQARAMGKDISFMSR